MQRFRSSYIKKTTTTKEIEKSENFLKDTPSIDYKKLEKIGFSKNHLHQLLYQKKLSSEEIQNSIEAFAFDIDENKKIDQIKKSPLDFFMGILSKGVPYAFPSNYESEKDILLRQYVEKTKSYLEKKESLIKEFKNTEFRRWFEELSLEDKKSILPSILHPKINTEFVIPNLKKYFTEKIWEGKKPEEIQSA